MQNKKFLFTEFKFVTSNFRGSIIDDLSNEYGCDFGSPLIDYTICTHMGGSTDCFASPCGNGKIYTSFCNQSTATEEKVSLQVSGVDINTTVSIFCLDTDCHTNRTRSMLFNINVICKLINSTIQVYHSVY